MAQCITCGSELHPERAEKYDYCLAQECQEKNLKGLTMVAVGVNKSAEQYLLLDDQTRDELARGKFHDQRRGSFGTSVPSASPDAPGRGAAVQKANPDGKGTRAGRAIRVPPGVTRYHVRGPNPRRNWRFFTTSRDGGRKR